MMVPERGAVLSTDGEAGKAKARFVTLARFVENETFELVGVRRVLLVRCSAPGALSQYVQRNVGPAVSNFHSFFLEKNPKRQVRERGRANHTEGHHDMVTP